MPRNKDFSSPPARPHKIAIPILFTGTHDQPDNTKLINESWNSLCGVSIGMFDEEKDIKEPSPAVAELVAQATLHQDFALPAYGYDWSLKRLMFRIVGGSYQENLFSQVELRCALLKWVRGMRDHEVREQYCINKSVFDRSKRSLYALLGGKGRVLQPEFVRSLDFDYVADVVETQFELRPRGGQFGHESTRPVSFAADDDDIDLGIVFDDDLERIHHEEQLEPVLEEDLCLVVRVTTPVPAEEGGGEKEVCLMTDSLHLIPHMLSTTVVASAEEVREELEEQKRMRAIRVPKPALAVKRMFAEEGENTNVIHFDTSVGSQLATSRKPAWSM